MTTLDIEGGFDVHDHREGLKLRTQSSTSMRLENRAGFRCPACDRPFNELLVVERDHVSFNSAPNKPLCLVRTPEGMLVLTH